MRHAIGIDLGGTKIEIIGLDLQGKELLRRRQPTPRSYEGVIEALAAMVAEAERDLGGTATVGIGHPGAISPATGLMKNSNSTWLNGRPFDQDVAKRLARPVALANDANCLALSEATDGAGAGAETVFAIILGTGTGAGIAVNGRVLTGPNAIAGEWGHNPLPAPLDEERPGPDCYCGRRGCIETWLSGPGLARDHERVNGVRLGGETIVQAALAGDATAVATMSRWMDRFARSLATVINLLDPDAIVLGGGVSRIPDVCERLPELLPSYVFSDTIRNSIKRSLHGDSSGVRGAAWLGRGLT